MSAIAVLAVTYFVMTIIIVSVYAVGKTLTYFETRPQTIAFLKTEATDSDIANLEKKLHDDPRIKQVRLVSREDALTIYKDATKDNPLLGELVSPSIFPPSIEFSVTDLTHAEDVLEDVKKEPVVETVGFTANLGGQDSVNTVIERLKTVSRTLRLAGIIAVSVLLVTSFLVLLVVMAQRVTMRKTEIESLSFLGATPGFIRTPIVLEALQYVFFGSLLGWGLAIVLVMYLTPTLFTYFGDIPVLPRDMGQFFVLFLIALAGDMVSAFLIALTSSVAAVSRSIRMVK